MDKQLFVKVCDEVIGQRQGLNGIGTLGEKTVHSVLKSYYSPENINHEIKVGGFVADICTGSEIIEIQTRDFNKLRRKLTAFLSFAPVTIVYPVPHIKWLRWVNPQTGEISPPRKSPKTGTPYVIFNELYKIKDYLVNPNLHLKIVLINLEEYRFLDGWSQYKKKGSSRCDRIPTEIIDEISINGPGEFHVLIPENLGEEFTSKDFKKASRLPMHHAQTALNVLHHLGAVHRIGKKGNSFVYSRKADENSIPQENESLIKNAGSKSAKNKDKNGKTAIKQDKKEKQTTKKVPSTRKKASLKN